MDIRTKIIIKLPETLIDALEITEETPFLVLFEDGALTVEPLSGSCEAAEENEYQDGFADGYEEGYSFGFHDGSNMRKFNKKYPRDCGTDCDYDCKNCGCR